MNPAGAALQAATESLYAFVRASCLVDLDPSVVEQALPERFEDVAPERQQHYRDMASAAVDAWVAQMTLAGPSSPTPGGGS